MPNVFSHKWGLGRGSVRSPHQDLRGESERLFPIGPGSGQKHSRKEMVKEQETIGIETPNNNINRLTPSNTTDNNTL